MRSRSTTAASRIVPAGYIALSTLIDRQLARPDPEQQQDVRDHVDHAARHARRMPVARSAQRGPQPSAAPAGAGLRHPLGRCVAGEPPAADRARLPDATRAMMPMLRT